MPEPFNQLTPGEAERLAILVEECGEVVQAVGKVLRHGYMSDNNGNLTENNQAALEREIGHVLHAIDRLTEADNLFFPYIFRSAKHKAEAIVPYLHHQGKGE